MATGDGVSNIIDMIFSTSKMVVEFIKEAFMLPLKIFAGLPNSIKMGFGIFLGLICVVIIITLWVKRKEFKEVYP